MKKICLFLALALLLCCVAGCASINKTFSRLQDPDVQKISEMTDEQLDAFIAEYLQDSKDVQKALEHFGSSKYDQIRQNAAWFEKSCDIPVIGSAIEFKNLADAMKLALARYYQIPLPQS